MNTLSIDLETFSSVPIAKAGMYKYVQSDDFEILLLAYSLNDAPAQIVDLAQGEAVPDWLCTAITSSNYLKYAYNAPFEWYCLSKYFQTTLPVNQWRDTMLHGLYLGYPAGLEVLGEALGLPQEKQKLTVGKALIRYFSIPCKPTKTNGGRTRNLPKHDPDKWELFKTYCMGDVTTEREIEKRLASFPVPQDIQEQWETDLVINSRGVAVDMELVDGALEIGYQSRNELTEEALQLTGIENPNSVAQLSKWLESQTGKEIDNLRKDTVAYMLKNKLVGGSAERVLQIRQEIGKTSTKKYDAIETVAGKDNRARGLIQFYGANRSGRWAGRLIQVQNLPRTYIDLKLLPYARQIVKEGNIGKLNLLFGSVQNTLSQLIRTAFVAEKDKVLIDADFSSIEARVVAWLAGEDWKLEVFRNKGDVYCATASSMFGVPVEKHGANSELRQKGKIAELACGYAGGVGALKAMGALDMGIPEEELTDIVAKWRQANKKIVELWYRVESAALAVVKTGRQTGTNGLVFAREYDINNDLDFMTIKLPSGRKLYYVHPELSENQWGKESITYRGVDQTTKQWTKIDTFGGKLVENLVQAISRDCLSTAIERLEKAGFPIVFHVHDEVVIECPKDKASLDKVIEIMTSPIAWAEGLSIDADGWTGDFFRKD